MKPFVSAIGLVFVLSFGVTETMNGTERGVGLSRTFAAGLAAQDAASLLDSSCAGCHEVGGWDHLAAYSQDDWQDLIGLMVSYGAIVSEPETESISQYLTATAALTIPLADAQVAGGAAPEGEGLLNTLCFGCHEVGGWDHLAAYSQDDWQDLIGLMVSYGAIVSEPETESISQYLTATAALTIPLADAQVAGGAAPEAEGLLNTLCFGCHEVGGWDHLAAYSQDDWQDLIARMVSYGAIVSEPETESISQYLTATAGLTIELADTAEGAVPDGGVLLQSACTACHDVVGFVERGDSAEVWRETIDLMLSYGASVNEEEINALVAFLSSADAGGDAGPDGGALLQSLCSACHDVVGFVERGDSAEVWNETIDLMLSYGAAVSDAEREILIRYLTGGARD